MGDEQLHPAVQRVLNAPGREGLLSVLADDLEGADLSSVLLAAMNRRRATITPAAVMAQYERDRFVQPAQVDAARLASLVALALAAVSPPFEAVTTAPLAPFGAHAALAGVHQDRVVTTARATEVVADPTVSLALEAARRRRQLCADNARSPTPVHLAAADRVVRAQRFTGPRSYAHFNLLGLVSAGRDTGNRNFETDTFVLHLRTLVALVARVCAFDLIVRLSDFSGDFDDVVAAVPGGLADLPVQCEHDLERVAGRGYYPNVCFKLAVVISGETVEVADGGIVTWTQALLQNRKERLMTSGLSLERLVGLAPGP